MVTIQEFKSSFNVTFTHSTIKDIYIPILGNVIDYTFSVLYLIVISQYEYDIKVITQVWGEAKEDKF